MCGEGGYFHLNRMDRVGLPEQELERGRSDGRGYMDYRKKSFQAKRRDSTCGLLPSWGTVKWLV